MSSKHVTVVCPSCDTGSQYQSLCLLKLYHYTQSDFNQPCTAKKAALNCGQYIVHGLGGP